MTGAAPAHSLELRCVFFAVESRRSSGHHTFPLNQSAPRMCGITGIIGGRASDSELLARMLARIRHRGPNGEGSVSLPQVALAHTRLSIIDLSEAAAQPMADPETGNVITFNGEIYNYREIADALGPAPPGTSPGDTATLLRAYGRWGVNCLERLRGMFAFALYDARQGRVLLARDRFGMKPLYYRTVDASLLFSSEIKSLLSMQWPHSANLGVLAGFMAYRHLDTSDETSFQEVRQLLPAHYAWVEPSGAMTTPRRYWEPPQFCDRPFTVADSAGVAASLRDSVAAHVRADVPVGAFVSGGVDSSSIACLADDLVGHGTLSTYSSILVDAHQNSENRLIPQVIARLESRAHNLLIDGRTFVDDLARVIDHHEEPLADASMYAHWRLSELCRQSGIRVVLSGNGGDELFGGYHSYIYGAIGSLLASGRLAEANRAIRGFHANGWGSRASLLARGVHEALPHRVRTVLKTRDAAQRLRHTGFAPLAGDLKFYYSRVEDRLAATFRDHLQHWTVPPFLHYEDRNGMAFGVEIRTPMLDHVLLEAVWSFDPRSLVAGRPKQALRTAMRGVVPDGVLDQPEKLGFAAPLDFYLQVDSRRFDECYREVVARCPYFETEPALRLLEDFRVGGGSRSPLWRVWRIFSIALWHERFMRTAWA